MRLINRPLALILAIALVGASVITAIEVVAYAVHAHPVVVNWPAWYHWARRTRWDTLVIRVWAAILIIVGVFLLALELKPRRITRLPVRSADTATDAALTRRGLGGALRAAATSIDGITGATVTVRRRSARVVARSAARGRSVAHRLRDPVRQEVRARLDALSLARPPRLRVHVVPSRNR
jgi:hypothetical protein